MPNCKLQHCNWHVSQNIKKRLAGKKYLAEERNTIMNHVWWYIQSDSEADLVENRKRLLEMVGSSEKSYMIEHWIPREHHFNTSYTKTSPNLGCNSNQRAESTHPVTTTLLNHQLSLAEAVRRLSKGIPMLLRDLDEEEPKAMEQCLEP